MGVYFAGASLKEHLQVPVGIICCSWGGTRASCWMSRETVEQCGKVWMEDYEAGLKSIPDPDAARKAYYADPNLDCSHPFESTDGSKDHLKQYFFAIL